MLTQQEELSTQKETLREEIGMMILDYVTQRPEETMTIMMAVVRELTNVMSVEQLTAWRNMLGKTMGR